jgi:hypothetical protein
MSLSIETPRSRWPWVTGPALGLLIAVVITRFTTSELLRDPFDVSPGTASIARAPGPATGLVLDLLCVVPALLVLTRATFDASFPLVRRWSSVWMAGLAGWTLASVAWSADKFSAAVEASHLCAALCVLWTAAQLVRDGARLRLVAAIGFGLLLVLVAQSAVYRAIDVQDTALYWQQHKTELLREHHWDPGSFQARQFELKITSGEMAAFFTSPNTFAAAGVLLLFVSLGLGVQKVVDGDGPGWLALPAVAVGAAVWILLEARSKTSAATPLLGAALLMALHLGRDRIRLHPRRYFWIGTGAVTLVIAAVIGHGIRHGGLFPGHFSSSLDFRWKYWVASAHLFARHPLIGVGWSNFGLHYLSVRLPSAVEEIKDPHNLFVRVFVELGAVGGILGITWMLRALWEMLVPAPRQASDVDRASQPPMLATAAAIAVGGIALSVLVNVDFTQSISVVVLESIRRLLYLLVLLLGSIAGAMRPQHRDIDDRPGPWVFRCLAVGLLLLVVHNLIDFSLFETGMLFLSALLAGAAMGTRAAPPPAASTPHWSRRTTGIGLAGAAVATILMAILLVAPVVSGEQSAYDGDEAIRSAPLDSPAQLQAHWQQAAADYQAALSAVPYNADYAMRAARASAGAGDTAEAQRLVAVAQRVNPMLIDADLMQANLQLASAAPNASVICADFERSLQRNPNDASLHLQYAQALERLGRFAGAAEQMRQALWRNDQLPAGEPRRLSAEQVADVQERIRRDESH